VFGDHEVQAIRVEEGLDVLPHDPEVGFGHVGPITVHAVEPLHGDSVVSRIIVAAVVR